IAKISARVKLISPADAVGSLRHIDRGAGVLLPMLRDDMPELAEQVRKFGQMSTATAVSLKAASDEVTFFGQVLLSRLGPAIVAVEKLLTHLLNWAQTGAEFVKQVIVGSGKL